MWQLGRKNAIKDIVKSHFPKMYTAMTEKNLNTSPPIPPVHRTAGSWLKIILSVAIALLIIGFFARNLLLGTPVETYQVIQTELRQTVVASGRVASPQRVSVSAEINGRVKSIPVMEGQVVRRGQPLILLDDNTERASLAEAQAAVALAEAKIRQQREVGLPTAHENLRQAQADVEQTRQELIRTRKLYEQNYISRSELDIAQRNLSVADSKLDSAKLQVEANQAKGSTTLQSLMELDQSQAALRLAQVKLEQTKILATANGTLISRSVEPGDIATLGKELMVLAVKGDTLIEVQVDEKNLAKVTLGQIALCSADAYQQQRFNAEVVYINPSLDATRGAIAVKLKVSEPPTYLRQDMTVSVDIETSKKSNALVIPGGALHDRGSDAPWVLVVRDKHAARQDVTLGLLGDENIEILTGLKEGEHVIPANLGLIKANQRVRLIQ